MRCLSSMYVTFSNVLFTLLLAKNIKSEEIYL